jgi:hypothetical protein
METATGLMRFSRWSWLFRLIRFSTKTVSVGRPLPRDIARKLGFILNTATERRPNEARDLFEDSTDRSRVDGSISHRTRGGEDNTLLAFLARKLFELAGSSLARSLDLQ